MAVIVDPLRLDMHDGGQERRRRQRHVLQGDCGRHNPFPWSLDPLYILCHRRLKHDPERRAVGLRPDRCGVGFPRGKCKALARRSCSNKNVGARIPSRFRAGRMTEVALTTIDNLKRPEPQALASALEALAARFGNKFITSQAVREQHAHTTTWLPMQPPDAVVMAQETADIQDTVRICARHGVPVIAFGTGTSLEGHVNAPAGGISIDLRDMNKVLAVHADDLDCVIEPGVTRKALNEHLRDQGVFFPIDPGADASLGGMASTRASGTNAVRYGTMRENVLALKVVRGDGEIITTGTRAKKSSAGYDLTRLIVGSEGTLGVITELTLRLAGIPEAIAAGVCPFPTVEACCNATILTIQSGIPVARIELLDALQVRACNGYSKLSLPETPMLFLEFHGSEAGVAEQSQRFGEIARDLGGGPFDW